jgi:hypothetical protein
VIIIYKEKRRTILTTVLTKRKKQQTKTVQKTQKTKNKLETNLMNPFPIFIIGKKFNILIYKNTFMNIGYTKWYHW